MDLRLLQSSLVLRFVNNDFQENKEPTIGGMGPRYPFANILLLQIFCDPVNVPWTNVTFNPHHQL